MPEHETPDLADLDAAFARLEQDVSTLSSAPGARVAVARARRRRRTTIGAVAAVAVLAVGGSALARGVVTREDSIGPADLPQPATFDATALTQATQGWESGWRVPTKADQHALDGTSASPHCLDGIESVDQPATPSPARSGRILSTTAPVEEVALGTLALWSDDHPDASTTGYAAVVTAIDRCARAGAAHDFRWDGGRGRSWSISGAGGTSEHFWVVQAGPAVGMLWMGGSGGTVPDDVDGRVATALVAGLLSPDSFTRAEGADGGSDSASASSSPLVTLSDAAFARAVRGWDTAWQRGGSGRPLGHIPCLPADWRDGAASAAGASLGGNGDQQFAVFISQVEARAAVAEIRKALLGCGSSAYDVSDLLDHPRTSLLAAHGPVDLWVVRSSESVGIVAVPAGSTAPPEQVSDNVGGQLLATVDSNAKNLRKG